MQKVWLAAIYGSWTVFVTTIILTYANLTSNEIVPYITKCSENQVCDLTNIGALIIGASLTAVLGIYIFQRQIEHASELSGIEDRVVTKLTKKEEERTGHAKSTFDSDLKQVKSLIQGLIPLANARRELLYQDEQVIQKKDKIANEIIEKTNSSVGSLSRDLLGEIRTAAQLAKLAPQWEGTFQGTRELRNTNNACENAIKKIDQVLEKLSSSEE